MTGPPPTVCFFQAYNRDYLRAETLRAGLAAHGVVLLRCQVNRRSALRYPLALARFVPLARRADVVLANFRSFELLPLLRALTRKPIVYDPFISFWQSSCEERQWFAPGSVRGRLLFALDRWDCRLADHVLVDSEAHREFFRVTFGLDPERLTRVYPSCEEALFAPRPPIERPPDAPARISWIGTGIPVQGLDVLVAAFGDLERRGARAELRIGGWSPLLAAVAERVRAQGPRQVTFLGQLSRAAVADEVAACDVGLGGHFSLFRKADQVISGKAVELAAAGKAMVLGNGAANRELFRDGDSAVFCERGSAGALADAIARLLSEPELAARVGRGARRVYEQRLRPRVVVEPLLPVLDALRRRPA